MADNNIFRKQALDTVSNPEQLDQHVRITKPSVWIIVVGILAIIVGVFFWAVTGSMTSSERIRGVLFPSNSVKMGTSTSGGVVTDVLIDEGETVEKGDVLAVVPDLNLLEQISQLRAKYESASGNEKEQLGAYLEMAISEYVDRSFIKASKGGTINKIVNLNDKVEAGQDVAINIVNEDNSGSKEILAYVPYAQAMEFKVGMEVQVTPYNLKREEVGYISGAITKIGTTTITAESIKKSMGSNKYATALGLTGTEVEVKVRLNSDSSSKNGFQWSNSKGANAEVEMGSICDILVIKKNNKPIEMLI